MFAVTGENMKLTMNSVNSSTSSFFLGNSAFVVLFIFSLFLFFCNTHTQTEERARTANLLLFEMFFELTTVCSENTEGIEFCED